MTYIDNIEPMKNKKGASALKHHTQTSPLSPAETSESEPSTGADRHNPFGQDQAASKQISPSPSPPSFLKNPIGIAAVATAVATVIYTFFAGQQWVVMSRQLTEMKNNSRQSTETAYRELRPYLSVSTMQLAGNMADRQEFNGSGQILNSGRTPAVDVRVCADFLIALPGSSIREDFPCPNPDTPNRSGVMSSVTSIGSGIPVSFNSFSTTTIMRSKDGLPPQVPNLFELSLENGLAKMFFYGTVTYEDFIEKGAAHHTNFCGDLRLPAKVFRVCDKHTSVD